MDENTKSVITPNMVKKHNIKKYSFKSMKEVTNSPSQNSNRISNSIDEEDSEEDTALEKETTQMDKKFLDIIEAILKKSEDLEKNLKRVESTLENQKSQFEMQLEETKKRSYEDGFKDGSQHIKLKLEEEVNEVKSRLLNSVGELNSTVDECKNMMQSLEGELSSIALDIAKEVIIIESSENSKLIAKELATELMQNLKDATKITIKVHPEDYEFILETFKDDTNLTIEANSSIAKGGVVIVSDIGNIDGSVMTRFNNIKSSIQEAKNGTS